jgi:F-type H+-transporting ATPase subunit epsilon
MLKLEIITPEKTLFEGSVKMVKVPGSKGSFGILQNHAPIISSLDSGKVTVLNESGKEEFFEIKGGVVEVLHNTVTVLVTE